MQLFLWLVTWRDRGVSTAWKVDDDGQYDIGRPHRHEDSRGTYWQVAVWSHNRAMAVLDAAPTIQKAIRGGSGANIKQEYH